MLFANRMMDYLSNEQVVGNFAKITHSYLDQYLQRNTQIFFLPALSIQHKESLSKFILLAH